MFDLLKGVCEVTKMNATSTTSSSEMDATQNGQNSQEPKKKKKKKLVEIRPKESMHFSCKIL